MWVVGASVIDSLVRRDGQALGALVGTQQEGGRPPAAAPLGMLTALEEDIPGAEGLGHRVAAQHALRFVNVLPPRRLDAQLLLVREGTRGESKRGARKGRGGS